MSAPLLLLAALAASSSAHAAPSDQGAGAVRVSFGGGAAEVGGAARVGLDGEFWVLPRMGVGARLSGGMDGFDDGRSVFLGEVLVPLRLVGGDRLSLVATPGLGVAQLTARPPPDGGVDAQTLPIGTTSSASLGLALNGRIGFLSLAAGPRFETYAFRGVAGSMNVGVGVGW